MTGDTTVMLGDTAVRIHGEHPLVARVLAELEPARTMVAPTVDISVGATMRTQPPRRAVTLGPVTTTGEEAWCSFERAGLRAYVPPPDRSGRIAIEVAVGDKRVPFGLPDSWYRWCEPTFMSPLDAQAYVFLLRIVEGALFLFGGATALLHASAVQRGARAAVITSAGGVGKTSIATRLLAEGDFRYLSDDMLPLSASGAVGAYPRHAMVYAYNLARTPELRARLRRTGGWRSAAQWSAHRPVHGARRRRRIDPAVLYGPAAIGRGAPLCVVAFLRRGQDGTTSVEDAGVDEVARRCRAVMANEQLHLGVVLHAGEAAGHPRVRFEDALDRHEAIYRAAFARSSHLVDVTLPASGAIDEGAAAIAAIVDGS